MLLGGYPGAWWRFIASPARWTESHLNTLLTWIVLIVPSVGGGLIGGWKLGTWQGIAIGALWFSAYLMVAGTRMQHERDVGPHLVFGDPDIKEGEGMSGYFFAYLPVSNKPPWPKASADVAHARAEVAFYDAARTPGYQSHDVPPFEARWSSNDWPRGGPLPPQETTLYSNGHADAVELAVMQKHSAAHWWNNETANDLQSVFRMLPLDDYFVHVRVIGHDAKAEQWLRLRREKGKPLPTIKKIDRKLALLAGVHPLE